jgi:hypothetical protein
MVVRSGRTWVQKTSVSGSKQAVVGIESSLCKFLPKLLEQSSCILTLLRSAGGIDENNIEAGIPIRVHEIGKTILEQVCAAHINSNNTSALSLFPRALSPGPKQTDALMKRHSMGHTLKKPLLSHSKRSVSLIVRRMLHSVPEAVDDVTWSMPGWSQAFR